MRALYLSVEVDGSLFIRQVYPAEACIASSNPTISVLFLISFFDFFRYVKKKEIISVSSISKKRIAVNKTD